MKLAPKLLILLAVIALVCTIADAYAEPLRVMSVQARGGLRVHRAAALDSTVTYLLDDTETVVVLAVRDGWTLVAKNNNCGIPLGWVSSDYLK